MKMSSKMQNKITKSQDKFSITNQSQLNEICSKYSNIKQTMQQRSNRKLLDNICLSTVIFASLLAVVSGEQGNNQLIASSSTRTHHHQSPNRHSPISSSSSSSNNQQLTSSSSNQNSGLFKDLSGPISGKIQTLDVICGKNFMTVRAEFTGPFYGIVFSKGTYGQENCIYVKPNSGLTSTAFNVYYDQCGSKPDLQGKFYENTIVIQYGSDIIEAYDEAKRLRCEWFEAYEKPATFKPAIPVADLEVVEMNFQGDDIDCWMEIQEGIGSNSREVSKLVSVGQPMTIVVAINDYSGIFDMRVKSCVAYDGVNQPLQLTDEFGCVLRPKMLTPFTKVKNPSSDKKATILSYARFLAFKFPDSLTVQIQCTVEVCRNGCAEACQRIPSMSATTLQPEISLAAKWPAAPNQPAIESSVIPQRVQQPQQQPKRTSSDINEDYSTRSRLNSRPALSYNGGGEFSDDMSSSDSNQQPKYIQPAQANNQNNQINTQRRSHQSQTNPSPLAQAAANFIMDGRIPQYLMPIDQQHGRRLSANSRQTITSNVASLSSTQANSTSATPSAATTIATSTTESSSQTTNWPGLSSSMSDNRQQGGEDSTEQPSVGDNGEPESNSNTRLNLANDQSASQASKPNEQIGASSNEPQAESQPSVQADPMDNKPEASSVVKVSISPEPVDEIVANNQKENDKPIDEQSNNSNNNSNNNDNNNNKPSEESSANQASPVSSGEQPSGNSDSSLKTVEVEIPANEDPQGGSFLSGGAQSNNVQFNPVRLSSNIDNLGSNGGNVEFSSNKAYEDAAAAEMTAGYKQQDQIIQPRESQQMAKREKNNSGDSSNMELAGVSIMGSGKNRFGARQQSQTNQPNLATPINVNDQQQASAQQPANHQPTSSIVLPSNSQDSSSSSSSNRESLPSSVISSADVGTNSDKVLIDRSDETLDLTFPAPNNQGTNNRPSSEESSYGSGPTGADESSSYVEGDSLGKIKPVVGTEELASGPLQLEDRIGAPAPQETSIEEALKKLQQQMQQSSQSIESNQHQSEEKFASQMKPSDENVISFAPKEAAKSDLTNSNERLDSIHFQNNKREQQQHQQQPSKAAINNNQQQAQRIETNQPFPNVVGQSKVLPDPTSSLNTRGSMVAQASNEGASASVLPAVQLQQQQMGNPIANINHQQQKPVAQVTNVPVAIGFSANQIPTIQQMQQVAYFQQQQQILSQQTTTTAKPSVRSRLNMLSPQAALQAVASRFLPKSSSSNANQQQQTSIQSLPLAQQLPHLLSNMKLLPEQQKVAQPNQQNQFFGKHLQIPNRIQNIVNPQQQPQPQPQATGGLFARFAKQQQQQQQQPLVRSRRSALMPNGKQHGTGEVGVAKTFMVVTNMDLAFAPNLTASDEYPEILRGKPMMQDDEGEIIYGVCMSIASLTFVLTCVFWLFVFTIGFSIYLFIKSRRQLRNSTSSDTFLKK